MPELTLDPWLGIALVLAALGAALAGLRVWQVHRRPGPEWVRKGLHVSMSAVVLSFPWLFAARWPVVALAVLALGAMVALRGVRTLREGPGRVLNAVRRHSTGELWFPVAVCLLFFLSGGTPLRYGVPVLVLGLADPAAALAGRRWGHARYGPQTGAKTAEGSLAFFAIAAGAVLVPLALTGAARPAAALPAALLVAALATLAEAVARGGLDNLLVPLIALLALDAVLGLEAAALWRHLIVVASSSGVALSLCLLPKRPDAAWRLRRPPAPLPR